MKSLREVLGGYEPKPKGEKRFAAKHFKKAKKNSDTVGDINVSKKVKAYDRKDEHGYNPGADEKVYEAELVELAGHDQYERHHSRAKAALKRIGDHLDKHKKHKMSNKNYCDTWDIKSHARSLEDTADNLEATTENLDKFSKTDSMAIATKGTN